MGTLWRGSEDSKKTLRVVTKLSMYDLLKYRSKADVKMKRLSTKMYYLYRPHEIDKHQYVVNRCNKKSKEIFA